MTTTASIPVRLRTHESGSFVLWWLIGIAAVSMLTFALLADGSRVLAGISDTSDVAQVAARAAARQVDPNTGLLDGPLAEAAAQSELAAAGMTGTVDIDADTATATAVTTVDLPLLALLGKPSHTVESTRTANATSNP